MHTVSANVVLSADRTHPYKVVLREDGLPTREYFVDSVREGEELIRSVCIFSSFGGIGRSRMA